MDYQELQRIKNKYDIIGNDPLLDRAIETALAVAPTDLTVLVSGESGVGKENIPKIIHQNSRRRNGKYFAVNCGAIPEGTIESELFGHEKGAYTGAIEARKGYFEEADGGTLFLDEIGELPLPYQAKLLRVLQSGEYTRVGSSKVSKTDVRVVAASNVDLAYAVSQGKFREDLYYRINSVEIEIPPLRGHLTDLWSLCNYFINIVNEKYGIHTEGINPDVLSLFAIYNWPGNIRELRHTIERLAYLNPDSMITLKDCDFVLKKIDAEELKSEETELYDPDHSKLLHNRIDNMEAKTIRQALEAARWNKTLAAKKLGINRSVLYKKMKKYHIDY